MTIPPMSTPTRRAFALGFAALAVILPGAASARKIERRRSGRGRDRDPTDDVPSWFSVRKFTSLSANQIHKVNLAIKRNRTIIIEGYTASQSRQIIKDAARDWPGTKARLLANQ